MPESAVYSIYQEKESLKNYASAIGAGWDDHVKSRFYSSYLNEIYSVTDSFYSNTLSHVQRIKANESKLQGIWDRVKSY